MNLKKFLTYALIALVLFKLIADPAGSANMVNTFINAIWTFFTGVASGTPV